MKPLNIILIVTGILVLTGVIILVSRSNKQARIKAAGKAAGLPDVVAQTIAESTDPEAAARSIGVPANVATAIAGGVSVNPAFLTNRDERWVWGGYNRSCPSGFGIVNGGPDDGWCKPLSSTN